MKITGIRTPALAVLLAAVLNAAPATAGPLYTQTLTLRPGWNAVYLEAQPPTQDPEAVFAGVPVESVWTWVSRRSAIEFVQDPSEALLHETGWRGYFPSGRPEAFLTNLFAIQGGRAYLVLLGGTRNVTWNVTGRPAHQPPRWVPDSFNLVGVGQDASPPTFGAYFAASAAHAGQPIYRLVNGAWELVADPSSTGMTSGEAFWVYTRGASDYQGPMHVELPFGDGLDFGESLDEIAVELTNVEATSRDFKLELLNPTGGTADALAYASFDAVDGFSFPALPPSHTVTVPAGNRTVVRLVMRRANMTADTFEALLKVTDGAGGRRLLPLTARKLGVPPATAKNALRRKLANDYQGLWIGSVSIDKVAEVRVDADTPTATDAPFDAQILLHVDSGGTVRLLKQVIQMWKDGTTTTDPATGLQTLSTPGGYVLVTDPTKIPSFRGATVRGDKLVGRRFSTPFLDFDKDSGAAWDDSTKTLKGTGVFGTGSTVNVTLNLSGTSPTNPFRHRYHNLHDGADSNGNPKTDELIAVARTLKLTFASTDPEGDSGTAKPDWGVTRLGGTYEETISGLHNADLKVAGTFTLQRISILGALNQ